MSSSGVKHISGLKEVMANTYCNMRYVQLYVQYTMHAYQMRNVRPLTKTSTTASTPRENGYRPPKQKMERIGLSESE
jgi:hypothetical protein